MIVQHLCLGVLLLALSPLAAVAGDTTDPAEFLQEIAVGVETVLAAEHATRSVKGAELGPGAEAIYAEGRAGIELAIHASQRLADIGPAGDDGQGVQTAGELIEHRLFFLSQALDEILKVAVTAGRGEADLVEEAQNAGRRLEQYLWRLKEGASGDRLKSLRRVSTEVARLREGEVVYLKGGDVRFLNSMAIGMRLINEDLQLGVFTDKEAGRVSTRLRIYGVMMEQLAVARVGLSNERERLNGHANDILAIINRHLATH